ncbi:MAG TPA: hypothetical protein DDY32_15980 [Desulfobulbaceae bacterium]|nr:hypothetical protein [Desulfobulbaceae bacterium]
MNTAKKWRERFLYFSLGVISLAAVFLLLGASSDFQNNTLNFGRYAISSWATQIDNKSGVIGAFVLDTVSGETRTVYMRTYGDTPESKMTKNDLKKPFIAIE